MNFDNPRDIQKSTIEYIGELLSKLRFMPTGGMDVITKDKSVSLKEEFEMLCTLRLLLRDPVESPDMLLGEKKEMSIEDEHKILFHVRDVVSRIEKLFFEQVERIFLNKSLSDNDRMSKIEKYITMLQESSYSILVSVEMEVAKHQVVSFTKELRGLFLRAVLAQMANRPPFEFSEYDKKILALSKWSDHQPLPRNKSNNAHTRVPCEFNYSPEAALFVKIAHSQLQSYKIPVTALDDMAVSIEEGELKVHYEKGGSGGFLNNVLKGDYMRHYAQFCSATMSLRRVVTTCSGVEAVNSKNNMSEHTDFLKEYTKEWRQFIDDYDITNIPDFSFQLRGKFLAKGRVEIVDTQRFQEILPQEIYASIADQWGIIIVDNSEAKHSPTFDYLAGGTLQVECPGQLSHLKILKRSGLPFLSVIGYQGNASDAKLLYAGDEFLFTPNGQAVVEDFMLQFMEQIKKYAEKKDIIEVPLEEAPENEVYTYEMFANEQLFQAEEPLSDSNTSLVGTVVSYEGRCYEIVALKEGHTPTFEVQNILKEIRKQVDIPDYVTLIKLPSYAKHIGFREVARILTKHFDCQINKKTGSSHFHVSRDYQGAVVHSTLLAPERNKYSKNASFGTLTSILRKLMIDESLFWNVVNGSLSAGDVLEITSKEYKQRLKDISNKLI